MDNPFDDELFDDDEVNPLEAFLSEVAEMPSIDPSTMVTLQGSDGRKFTVAVEGPTPLAKVLQLSGLNFQEATEYWVNGTRVDKSMEVGPGSVVTATTVVKGG
jgi:hypothetical protein